MEGLVIIIMIFQKLDKKYLDNLLNKDFREGFFEIIEIDRNSLNTKERQNLLC